MAQILTGHGGFAQYLHRFKLKDSPYCACDPAKIQDMLHVLEECPVFLRERVALETEIDVIVGRREFPIIIEDDQKRKKFFDPDDTNTCVVANCSPSLQTNTAGPFLILYRRTYKRKPRALPWGNYCQAHSSST
ncbi:hypothetical protein EVAR_16120_1 [Eumeta japonica]|uniref:Retrovirus-related Pol polyprotein from type-1 retrotransposable element R1 n=1 Tax=Eumeta variegata TaxID=151549 RepID=A0A4C1UJY0_EUMVA|nr:hypothetical protein EVAR_16120_1 [Eumeta japonica]